MSTTSFYVRNMLHQYDRQLVTSRRLARYRQVMQLASGEQPELSADARRQLMVERVARELFENLLFTGSDTPMVQEIQNALMKQLNERLVFKYPPGELNMHIMRETDEGFTEVSPQEKQRFLDQAWKITLAIVDDTML